MLVVAAVVLLAIPGEAWGGGFAAIAALVGSLVAWAKFRRSSSGSIDTTDAGRLWDEAERVRRALRGELDELRADARRLQEETIDLMRRVINAEGRAAECERVVTAQRERIAELEAAAQ